jgi:hypothetical protein
MFQVPASAVVTYVFSNDFQGIALERFRIRGSPVELARSKPRLIAAVPRPSSPLNARASTMHPIELDHTFLFLFSARVLLLSITHAKEILVHTCATQIDCQRTI